MAETMLIILDGFGLNPVEEGNPIYSVETPNLDFLIKSSPHVNLNASAESVGLSWGEVGNSEVGHSNIGTGQIIWQNLPRIRNSIKDGSFFENKVILETMKQAHRFNSSLHLVGLLSDGGVHSHIDHLFALIKMAKSVGLSDVYIHAFTDGRDTPSKRAKRYFDELNKKSSQLGIGKVSTVSGRYYAMDRDNHWERIEEVYKAMIGESQRVFKSAEAALTAGYEDGLNDETIQPSIISAGNPKQFLQDNDAIIIFNFRADRAREITLSLADERFKNFKRKRWPKNIALATMTPYETDWKIKVNTIFGALEYENPLSNLFSAHHLRQLHIAETEKYAHVTYFFNGGREKEVEREKYSCISSPRIESYAKKPEMSLYQVVSELLAEISKVEYQFVVTNFANPDMVGHTGDFEAAKKALLAVDKSLGYLLEKACKNFQVYITSDHGNIEQMINLETKEIDKEHTTNPVFFVKVDEYPKGSQFSGEEHKKLWMDLSFDNPKGILADITPTIAENLGISGVEYFSGQSLNAILKN